MPAIESRPALVPHGIFDEPRRVWPDHRTVNIVFHGHSVPSGYFATPLVKPLESYPHLTRVWLSKQFPTAVVNVITTSIGGEHAIRGAERFGSDVLTLQPDLVFVDYALNDRGQDALGVEAAWVSMVRSAKSAGVPIVLLTPTGDLNADYGNPADKLHQRAELVRRVAAQHGVPLVDVFQAWQATLAAGVDEASLHSQGNHPSRAGHEMVTAAIVELLEASVAASK